MSINDRNRARKTYSFFRTAPSPTNPLSTTINVSDGLIISGDANAITIAIDPEHVMFLTGTIKTGSYSVLSTDRIIVLSGTSGAVTMSLPASPVAWEKHTFKDGDGKSTTNRIIISASAGMRIDSSIGTEITTSYGTRHVVFVGNNLWNLV
jgi:hypothetical protein